MNNGFLSFASGLLIALSGLGAQAQELCEDGAEPRMSVVGSNIYTYAGAARHLGQPVLAARGYTGQGTAIAHIEKKTLSWFFRYDDGRPPPFGACVEPANRKPDHWGFAPESDPAYPESPCKIAWVMCLEPHRDGGQLVSENNQAATRGLQACTRLTDGQYPGTKKIFSDRIGGHATSGAIGMMTMAPDTKIVAIALGGVESVGSRAAFRWLYTKPSDYVSGTSSKGKRVYLAADDSKAWVKYWRDQFGDQSPAEKFNIVAATLNWRIGIGGFNKACKAVNPAIPQTNSDGDSFIDIADNCVNVTNEVRINLGTEDEPFYTVTQPDSDKDGRGNKCDVDLDNDGDVDFDDFAMHNAIWKNFDEFEAPFDVNKDGVINEADRQMLYEAADFNSNGVVNQIDANRLSRMFANNIPGTSNIDLLPAYENVRNPERYLQDRQYADGRSFAGQSDARRAEFAKEFNKLRKAGILPVISTSDDGFTNGVQWPACSPKVLAVSGLQHTSDADIERAYDPDTNQYNIFDDRISVRINATQKLPLLVTHGPGRTWQPLEEAPNDKTEVPGCDVPPTRIGGYAGSYTPGVVAGSIAALKSPGLLPDATPFQLQELLMQTDEQAHVRRDCTIVPTLNRPAYDPEKASLYCPDHIDPAVDNTRTGYSVPLQNLGFAMGLAEKIRDAGRGVIADADKDRIYDSADNCIFVANRLQRDSDGDGYGDVCDGDYNNDGQTDWEDADVFNQQYDGTGNPAGDFDSNGIVEGADYDYLLNVLSGQPPGPSALDSDGDGIANHLDNCTIESNGPWTVYASSSSVQRNQLDSDGDFFGDVCDGDVNNDTIVDIADGYLLAVKARIGETNLPRFDFNADGIVDDQDLAWFNDKLFDFEAPRPPGPSGLCKFWLKMSDEACHYYD